MKKFYLAWLLLFALVGRAVSQCPSGPCPDRIQRAGGSCQIQSDGSIICTPRPGKNITLTTSGAGLILCNGVPCASGGGVTNVTLPPCSADSTGATDASAAINTCIALAVAAGTKRVYLPTGIYLISQAQITALSTIFNLASDNLEVFGDGVGKTIITMPASISTAGNVSVFLLSGLNQSIHDLSISGASTVSTSGEVNAIKITVGAYYSHIYNNEIYNMNGLNTAGAAGVDIGATYNAAEVSTTLGTVIVAGARTVTPASMNKIYAGRTLTIGGTTETITVTSITRTTFTATFANAHGASDAVTGISNANQYTLVENNLIRDSYLATAIICTSSGNTFRKNKIFHIGSNNTQHGLYMSAGNNLIEDNWVEGVSGYSFHQFRTGDHVHELSGNRWMNNTSLNPGTQHMVFSQDTSNGLNPFIPNLDDLERYTIVSGNTFKNTAWPATQQAGITSLSGAEIGVLFEQNILEDTTNVGPWVSLGDYSVISGNHARGLRGTASNAIFSVGSNGVVSNNTIYKVAASPAIKVSAGSIIEKNIITLTAGYYIGPASNIEVASNRGTGGDATFFTPSLSGLTGLNIHHNNFVTSAAAADIWTVSPTGEIANNSFTGGWFRANAVGALSKNLYVHDNAIQFSWYGRAVLLTKPGMGRLLFVATNNTTAALATARLVKLNASGELDLAGTGDTVFAGISISAIDNASGSDGTGSYIAGQPGTEFDGLATDGAWTVGHIGIISVTTAGKIHDNGTQTPPVAPASYVVFLDSGGGAGSAQVLVVKTL
jgi:hypothetical protein